MRRMTDHRLIDPRLRGDDGVFRVPYSKLNSYGIKFIHGSIIKNSGPEPSLTMGSCGRPVAGT